ncbi:MAG TPA: hypothetical protein ENH55_19515 [Aurantimonas coralicida]|uniref:Uncharacterized protein n=1 Tax=Aurantimonas coralicida TaxID=182270 RepID=A0A9C9NDH7_9HYPH|nr:hypothetical protein [Aurantimonas coralicida]HET99202.1 hypothetical protein [Aurantimonas coralicida]
MRAPLPPNERRGFRRPAGARPGFRPAHALPRFRRYGRPRRLSPRRWPESGSPRRAVCRPTAPHGRNRGQRAPSPGRSVRRSGGSVGGFSSLSPVF